MTTIFGPFTDLTAEEFERVTRVCYFGFVNGTRAALAHMLPRGHGTIVQVGSALAYRAIPLQSAYCGAKHAIRGFTDSVRTELLHARSKVWITMVQMPALDTPQFDWCENKMAHHSQPVAPIYDPSVAAEGIFFAAHHRRREVWVGGSTALVISGNKLLPGVGDWYLGKTGYASQQYDGPPMPNRANLWRPMDAERDHGARGSFSARAHRHSAELWGAMHKGALALVGVAATGALLAFALRGGR